MTGQSPGSGVAVLDRIDWADMAVGVRHQHGDEWVARYGDRLWRAIVVTAGVLSPGDAEVLRFGESPPAR